MAKYQFKATARGVKVIRHDGEITKVITSENLNKSDNAEFILKEYPHLIEEGKASKAREAEEEEQPEISPEKPEVAPEQPEQSEGEAKPVAKSAKK